VIPLERTGPQDMPDDLLEFGEHWHPATARWWKRWSESAITADWTPVDWSELEACAVLHHEFMKKRTFTLASEIRLRMAKFGATPEDRQRLRILLADADERDEKRDKPVSAREKYRGLRAVATD
jgi:hypothetical protein